MKKWYIIIGILLIVSIFSILTFIYRDKNTSQTFTADAINEKLLALPINIVNDSFGVGHITLYNTSSKCNGQLCISVEDTGMNTFIYSNYSVHFYIMRYTGISTSSIIVNTSNIQSTLGLNGVKSFEVYPILAINNTFITQYCYAVQNLTGANVNFTRCFNYTYLNLNVSPVNLMDLTKSKQFVVSIVTDDFISGNFNITGILNNSIDPAVTGCGTYTTENTTFTMDRNVSNTLASACMIVSGKNITFDCARYNITGANNASGIGVSVTGANSTVKNCNIYSEDTGINIGVGDVKILDTRVLSGSNLGCTVSGSNANFTNTYMATTGTTIFNINSGNTGMKWTNFTLLATTGNGACITFSGGNTGMVLDRFNISCTNFASSQYTIRFQNVVSNNIFRNFYIIGANKVINPVTGATATYNNWTNGTMISNHATNWWVYYGQGNSSYSIFANITCMNNGGYFCIDTVDKPFGYNIQILGGNWYAKLGNPLTLYGNNILVRDAIAFTNQTQSIIIGALSNNFTCFNNTLYSTNITAGNIAVYSINASNSVFFLNNITGYKHPNTTIYAIMVNSFNLSFNSSQFTSINQGNIYPDVFNGSTNITGCTNSSYFNFYVGNNGTKYPYNSTTALQYRWTGTNILNYADYAPITNFKGSECGGALANSCIYGGSGNFIITCTDQCTVSSNYNIGGNNLTFNGDGTVKYININNNITNRKNIFINNNCQVIVNKALI